MSEQSSAPLAQTAQTAPVAGQPAAASAPAQDVTPQQQTGLQAGAAAIADEKPEVVVGAAFAAGFMLAMILRRIAG